MVRREQAGDWPIFHGLSVAEVGVVSVEIARRPDETMVSAAADVSRILSTALREVLPGDRRFTLLAVGDKVATPSRIARFTAERDKLWGALERSGSALPHGTRVEHSVNGQDHLRFAGTMCFEMGELPRALEVTRTRSAVCVGWTAEHPVDCHDECWSIASTATDSTSLLRASIMELRGNRFVARTYGRFDDSAITSEVFAHHALLSDLDRALSNLP
ncbi:hypothetical protein [Kribbella flavida]|nr:hypothetical protein [Kribbella flavida]